MSEERRKNVRTQGRFSNDKEFYSSRREKDKPTKSKGSPPKNTNGGGRKSSPSAAAVFSVQYHEDSSYSFEEFEKRQKPEELRFRGIRDLCVTESGLSRIIYEPNFIPKPEAEGLMTLLKASTKWHDKNIVIRGEEYPQPRLVAWYGPFPYTYAGATLEAAEMPQTVLAIKRKVEAYLQKYDIDVELNSVLLNLYRTEKDSVAWHSDDELSMGICPTIASVSLGCVRKFEMRPKLHVANQVEGLEPDTVLYVNLTPGSLIIMDGCMQKDWQHRVPKEYHDKSPRINLTFRTVYDNQLPPEVPYKVCISSSKTAPSVRVVPQPEPKFDSESFPPLGAPVSDSKKLKKEEVYEDQSTKTPGKGEGYIDAESAWDEHLTDEDENQNNLNKEFSTCPSDDVSQSYYEGENNLNMNEPEKPSGVKFSTNNEYFQGSDASQMYQPNVNCKSEDFQNNQIHHPESADPSASDCNLPEPVTGIKREVDVGAKISLNVNAPDFVPCSNANRVSLSSRNKFIEWNLLQLAKYQPLLKGEDIVFFNDAIKAQLDHPDSKYVFSYRDWYELEVYSAINDDTLSKEHRIIILKRICSMVLNAVRRSRDVRSPHRFQNQRPVYNGEQSNKHKMSYKPSVRKY